jgi:hypothetical protein
MTSRRPGTYSYRVQPAPQTGPLTADPEVAATVRLLHRRHGWSRTAVASFFAFVLAEGANANAESQGTPPPSWFLDLVIVLAALTIVGIVAAVVDTVLLRRRPPAVRAQAAPLAAHHPGRLQAHHYPPRHWVIWVLRWVGMLLILVVAVVSVPAVVDGVAYLAGAGHTATFDPTSYQTNCQYTCQTSTDGILETGGTRVDASWPNVVPLGRPFQIRAPVWRWGLGLALIDSDRTAVIAVVISLLIEAGAVFVAVGLVRLVRNWRRHRRQLMAVSPSLPGQAG